MPQVDEIDAAVALRFHQLGDVPPAFDLAANDAAYGRHGAHTVERHGPHIPLQRGHGTRTIEGRLHGDPPWPAAVRRSYQWISEPAMNRAVNAYLRWHWPVIRIDLARRKVHRGHHDAGVRIGRGFTGDAGLRSARYGETTVFVIVLRVVPGSALATPFILTSYPRANERSGHSPSKTPDQTDDGYGASCQSASMGSARMRSPKDRVCRPA